MDYLLTTDNQEDIELAVGVATNYPRYGLYNDRETLTVVELNLEEETLSKLYSLLTDHPNYSEITKVIKLFAVWGERISYPIEKFPWLDIGDQHKTYVRVINTAITSRDQLSNNTTGIAISYPALQASGEGIIKNNNVKKGIKYGGVAGAVGLGAIVAFLLFH